MTWRQWSAVRARPWHLGSWSALVGTVAGVWVVVITMLLMLPQSSPITAETVSHAPIAVGVVVAFSDQARRDHRRPGASSWCGAASARANSPGSTPRRGRPGEAREDAVLRETMEETGPDATAIELLAERVHPKTGRLMSYTACEVAGGTAYVADTDELVELAG